MLSYGFICIIMASCRMIASVDDLTPTILGVLVLGVSSRDWIPGAYIQFLRINGTEMADPIQDEASIDGALGQVLRRIDEKIDAHNRIIGNPLILRFPKGA